MKETTNAILFLSNLANDCSQDDFFSNRKLLRLAIDALEEKEYLETLMRNNTMVGRQVFLTDDDEIFCGKIIDRVGSVITLDFPDMPELNGHYSFLDFFFNLSFTKNDAQLKLNT